MRLLTGTVLSAEARPSRRRISPAAVLRAFERGEAVGILMDQNMLLGEGVFVDFFGHAACTTTGPARIARKAGVPIVLGLVIWDETLKKYRLRFDAVEWIIVTTRKRRSSPTRAFHQADRRIRATLSRSVAVGPSALEDAAAR